jgi:hypothetical protein
MLDDIIDDLFELELNNQHFVCTIEELKNKIMMYFMTSQRA